MPATASGWVIYGSPLSRFWSWWASLATANARSMSDMSALVSNMRTALSSGASLSSTGFSPTGAAKPTAA